MWVTVLVLALMAMADPVRSGTAILLLSLRRPMRNLLAFWIGGIATAIVVGLCALFVLRDVTLMVMHRVAFTVESASAGHIGIVSGVLALLIAIGLFAYRRAPLSTSGCETSALVQQPRTPPALSRLSTRSPDGLEGGHLCLAFVAGLGSATPWEYLVALTAILASGAGPGAQVGAVVTFTVVAFAIAEIPLISYLAAASRTDAVMVRVHNWVRAHRRRILAVIVAVVGVFLLANGVGSVSAAAPARDGSAHSRSRLWLYGPGRWSGPGHRLMEGTHGAA
jgi:Sap, sulfolipid-1-addressing protein